MADAREPHAEHDPMVVAALLDRDLPGEERAIAESRIASCPACAAIHADLVALSAATLAQPTPVRSRAFTLTRADTARLAMPAPGEPDVAAARLGGVMTDPIPASDHASHDTMLVASLADHSLPASERTAAEALVAACSQCADLHADLLAVRTATRTMPTPPRPYDYSLTTRDVVRLRSGGWRRFVAILGTSRDALSRPLAVGLTTLGLAGLLVATGPSISLFSGGATSAPPVSNAAPAAGIAADQGDGMSTLQTSGAPQAAASAAPAPGDITGSAVEGSGAPERAPAAAAGATPPPVTDGATTGASKGQGGRTGTSRDLTASELLAGQDIAGVSPLLVMSIAFLVAGLGLFLLRWSARRFRGD